MHPHALSHVAEAELEAALHLPGGLVREGDGEDLVRLHAAGGDEVRDAVREDARLPRAGAGDDEHRALGGEDGLALRRVQVGEVLLGGGDRHRVDGIRRGRRSRTRSPDVTASLRVGASLCASSTKE